ncbi:MAG: aminotransferase class V-fold PLP-dependent enzyme, partial [Anaerolineae bacterium]
GTPNAVGLAGLLAGVRWVQERGVEAIRAHEQALTARLLEGLAEVPEVRVYGPQDPSRQTGTVSFNLEGWQPSEAGLALDEEYGILCRVGLHCAPAAHKTLGTFPRGTVRFAVGCFTTLEEVDAAVDAVRALARQARARGEA